MKLQFLIILVCVGAFIQSLEANETLFRDRIAPLFEHHCIACHEGTQPKGGLSLATVTEALAGGDGGPAIIPGKPDESALLDYISGDEPAMPKNAKPLLPDEVEAIREWIAAGATWPKELELTDKKLSDTDWWSLKPLQSPPPPKMESPWIRTPVDAFVLAKLEEHGLSPSEEADRLTLIRRLYFDLIGLPPAPAEVERFLSDPDPMAYENLVERLLASPHYGERWARHWLDVVHYADTMGFDKDKVRPHAWPYRDYVIRAFNQDKPYDRFVKEQLAGDVLYPGTEDGIVALGFIAAGPFDWVGQIEVANGTMEKKRVQNLDRDDMVSSTMLTFVSATAGCARCHNHKFDPISQQDYYGLQAVFAAVDRAERGYDTNPEAARRRTELTERLEELTVTQRRLKAESRSDFTILQDRRSDDLKEALARTKAQLAALPKQRRVYAAATRFEKEGEFVPTRGEPRPVYVLKRGNESSPDVELGPVHPCGLSALHDLSEHFLLAEKHSEGERRAALAEWIVDRRNPLTWRSIANRIWQYHFGRGLVETSNDFGRMGANPTHPELLDWLAAEFRDEGQSIKSLHRLICNSATYRQVSDDRESCSSIDAGNRLLWRMNRQKLDAEVIRDTVLAISGKLDRRMGGPGYYAFDFKDDHSPHYNYDKFDPDDSKSHRRSIYRLIVRSVPDPFMTTLDCADPSLNVDRRNETMTALQSLALLNNRFMVRMSEHFAAHLEELGMSKSEQVVTAYRLALGRLPSEKERKTLVRLAEEHGMSNVCRLIFNLNEFVFID